MWLWGEALLRPVPFDDYLLVLVSGALGIGIADTLFFKCLNTLGAGLTAIIDCLYSPFTIGLSTSQFETLIEELVESGLRGLEVYYPDHTPDQIDLYNRLAEKLGLVKTAGSDYHGKLMKKCDLGVIHNEGQISYKIVEELKRLKPCQPR